MTVYKFIELTEKEHRVCQKIDAFIEEGETTDVSNLLEEAEDVICQYRAFIYEIIRRVDIEKAVGKQVTE